MSEQDPRELIEMREAPYLHKVQKYILMVNKMGFDSGDALEISAQSGLMTNQAAQDLSDFELEKFVTRGSKQGIGRFEGRSLCVTEKEVRKIAQTFEMAGRNFFSYV